MYKLSKVPPLDSAQLIYPAAPSKPFKAPFYEVVAGYPSAAQDYIEQDLDLNEFMLGPRRAFVFFFRIVGWSMRDAGIIDGDIIIVDRALDVQDGHIVVAAVDGQYTCKYYRKTKNGVWLEPANPEFKSIKVTTEQDFSIFGRYDGLIRKDKGQNSKPFIPIIEE